MRQRQKLKKKLERKKEEKEKEKADGPQSRRKRFLDPDSPFGKQSLVYKLKYGDLREAASKVDIPQPVQPLPYRSLKPRQQEKPSERRTPERRTSERDSFERKFLDRRTSDSRSPTRPAAARRPVSRRTSEQRRTPPREQRPLGRKTRDNDGDSRDTDAAKVTKRKTMMPMNITYTTAASQFLYGKSVVQAALQQARRKLYNLYITGVENRKDSKEHGELTRLASRRGVSVTVVPKDEQRLMDKMSMGRPHNGYVLEASPLPQLPVTSLGKVGWSSGTEAPRLGFHVELDHQSKEEQAINGQDSFIPRFNNLGRQPFVLLLNEILDPGNLGALLRTASYLGVDAVGITNRSSSTLTPVVLKSAAGAVEEISIFTVDSPITFIENSRKAGWKAYAAVAPPDQKLVERHGNKFYSTDAIEKAQPLEHDPTILMLGNEGFGLPKPLKVAADFEVSVPRFVAASCVDSLNVSVAAGLLCHAFVKEPMNSSPQDKSSKTVPSPETRKGEGVKEPEAQVSETIF